MAFINPETGDICISMTKAAICDGNCDACHMPEIAHTHGLSVYNSHGMNCDTICEIYADEVADTYGYQWINTDPSNPTVKTTDEYFITLIREVPTVLNSMYIYDIHGPKQYHKYMVKGAKYSNNYLVNHEFRQIRSGIMPQHYECIVDTELEASRIADAVAMDTVIEFANQRIQSAIDSLMEVKNEAQRVLGEKMKYSEEMNRFWDNQDSMRRDAMRGE